MSGLTVIADGEDLDFYRIIEIKEGSPAEKADIRVNDIIESINGLDNEKLAVIGYGGIKRSRKHGLG